MPAKASLPTLNLKLRRSVPLEICLQRMELSALSVICSFVENMTSSFISEMETHLCPSPQYSSTFLDGVRPMRMSQRSDNAVLFIPPSLPTPPSPPQSPSPSFSVFPKSSPAFHTPPLQTHPLYICSWTNHSFP